MHLRLKNLQVYIFCSSCYLSLIMSAVCLSWPEPLTKWYISDSSEVPMSADELSWMIALVEAGAIVSPLPSGLFADLLGRKVTLLCTAVAGLASWCLVLFTRSLLCLYVSRVLGGLCLGAAPTVAPVYIAEVAPPSIRGALTGQLICMFFIGQLLVYCTGPYLSYGYYIYVCAALPLLFFISFLFAPETPYFYLKKNKLDLAKAAMKRLRGEVIQEELDQMTTELKDDEEIESDWKDLFKKGSIKCLLVLQVLSFVSHMNGLPSLSLYADETLDGESITIGMGLLLVITSFVAAFLTDPLGRKPLLTWSLLGSAVATAILAVYFFLKDRGSEHESLLYIGLVGFCIISSIGISPLIMTLQAELFPTSTRAVASAITELTLSLSSFICLKTFVPINDAYGVYVNFIIYTVLSLLGAIAVCFLPETSQTIMSSS